MAGKEFIESLSEILGRADQVHSTSYCSMIKYGRYVFYIDWKYLSLSVKNLDTLEMIDLNDPNDDTKTVEKYELMDMIIDWLARN